MAMIQVTALQVRNKAEEIQELNNHFKKQTQELQLQETSLGNMWEGQAKNAFHTAFMKDKDQMELFHNLLKQYVQALFQIATQYEQAEARNVELASSRNY